LVCHKAAQGRFVVKGVSFYAHQHLFLALRQFMPRINE
jgi:hypothetical protein